VGTVHCLEVHLRASGQEGKEASGKGSAFLIKRLQEKIEEGVALETGATTRKKKTREKEHAKEKLCQEGTSQKKKKKTEN
jgi:uncharacterized protein YggU (UPF0235/DUF167 family)